MSGGDPDVVVFQCNVTDYEWEVHKMIFVVKQEGLW